MQTKADIPRENTYIVRLPPIAWKRAGLHGRTFFDTQQQEKVFFGLFLSQQHKGPPFSNPVAVELVFYFQSPRKPKFRSKDNFAPTVQDCDNLCKFTLDALTKSGIWKDDRLVCRLVAEKKYSNEPRTTILIREIE